MKIVVIGGSGRIGSRLVDGLRGQGHEVTAASPESGIDAYTGAGLPAALDDAAVVVDVSNAPVLDPELALDFFRTTTGNLLAAAAAAGVGHYLALSIVGLERLPHNGYFQAKLAQEELIAAGPLPFTILRATQFFEFVAWLADDATVDGTARLPAAPMQPVAAEDVARTLTELAAGPPRMRIVELAGPDVLPIAELARLAFAAAGDVREAIADEHATYFGEQLDERSLLPGPGARISSLRFTDWLSS